MARDHRAMGEVASAIALLAVRPRLETLSLRNVGGWSNRTHLSTLRACLVTWRENIERVREALDTQPYWNPKRRRETIGALTALTAQIEELERERDFLRANGALNLDLYKQEEARAEAAEQRVEELAREVERLRGAVTDRRPDGTFKTEKIAAALAQSDPPED